MNIKVIGAGITGCTLARLLTDIGHEILIIEKLDHIGGLCFTKKSPNGILYNPFGGHVFHTLNEEVIKFINRFGKLNDYIHNKGIIINNILRHYPISLETINELPERKQILKELKIRQKIPDTTNFENYMISLFGKTLYKLFIYNYTKKMWGIEPRELTTEWAPRRIELRDFNSELFKGQWQGLPIEGYTKLFKKIIKDIPIEYNNDDFKKSDHNLVLFSGRIDELYKFKHGILQYRSLRFDYKKNEYWENGTYGTINLPQHYRYIRKANFKILYQHQSDDSWIQYQEPISLKNDNVPMYPVYTKENIDLFNIYLKEICKSDFIIPIGRLGLYKYLDMDKAILLAMEMISLIEEWKLLSPKERYKQIKTLLFNF